MKIVWVMKSFVYLGVNEFVLVDLKLLVESMVMVVINEWKYVVEVMFELDVDLLFVFCIVGEVN